MSRADLYQTLLDPSKPEIRLLELTKDDDVVTCRLHTVTFSSDLQYAALSYVWGDAADTADIEIDGVQVPVSRSLADALHQVRKYWTYEFPNRDQASFRIWVDAVCINQTNKVERTEQVKLMRSIYSSADLVLGWLGAEDQEQVVAAFCTIKVLGNIFRAAKWDVEKLKSLQWLETCGLVQEPSCDKFWNSLDYFGSLPYWRRIWILQENVLACTLFYITRNMSIEYRTLMNVCTMFDAISRRLMADGVNKPNFIPSHIWFKFYPPEGTGFIQLRSILRFSGADSLYMSKEKQISVEEQQRVDVDLMQYGSTLLATDPRDHIYGLLGLSSLPIEPDYNKNVREVYLDYCHAVLNAQVAWSKKKTLFLRDGGSGVFRNPLDLPSWVPQLPSRASGDPTLVFGEHLDFGFIVPDVPSPSISGDILQLSGVRLQTLKNVGGNPKVKNLQRGGDLHEWVQDYIKRIPFYATKIPSIWALFMVAMRTHQLAVDTKTMLLLQNFIMRLELEVPESKQRKDVPTYFQTPDVNGLSVGVSLDGGNNPQMMLCVSPLLDLTLSNPVKALETRQLEISGRLIFTLERNYHTRLFETSAGYLGMGPQLCRAGDIICIVDGYDDLVLLRQRGTQYEYVGPCMGYGINDLYIKRQLEAGEVIPEMFDII